MHGERNDEQTTIVSKLVRDALRMEDQILPGNTTLTPLDKIPEEMFEKGDSPFFGRPESQESFDPKLVALANLSLLTYSRYLETVRSSNFTGSVFDRYQDYGKHTKVIDRVIVSPVGPPGRYMVNFLTTNVSHAEDWEIYSSTFISDLDAGDLDHTYPARLSDVQWLVGQNAEGKHQIIGTFWNLYKIADGNLNSYLQQQGWQNIGEVRGSFINDHAGWYREMMK